MVEGQQVRELPLNGENFMQLVLLSPGVSAAQDFNGRDKGLGGGSDFSVNGNPYTNNLFLVDGVNNVDMGSGRTILVYPVGGRHRRIQDDSQFLWRGIRPSIRSHHQH